MNGERLASEHLAPLDGLRGLAIALVVWFHVWQITWLRADVHLFGATLNFNAIPETGFVGVDLFFFISGFCLFYPYARTLFDGRPQQTLATFAYRRALKILPSYYLSIALVIALGWTHFTSTGEALAQILSHVFFVHIFNGETYGGINGALWSLAVEVQFYVLFPLMAWSAMRRPFLTCGLVALAALAYRLVVVAHPNARYEMEQLPGTIDLFAAGILAAYAYRAIAVRAPALARRRGLWTMLALVGAAASAWSVAGAFDARLYANWPAAWEVWGRTQLSVSFAILTVGSLVALPAWQRTLANPALVFLSAISYNLYLCHTVVIRALRDAHIPPWVGADEKLDPTWAVGYTFVSFAVTIGVAWVLTRVVEAPLLRARPFEAALTKAEPRFRAERV